MLSIVIPIYNKASYLSETLQSILVQEGVEQVILVDDASTDNSLLIAKSFAEQHPQIKVIANTFNRGGGMCRNRGLNEVKTEFVMFMDADDMLSEPCIKNRLKKINSFPNATAWIFPMGCFRNTVSNIVDLWTIPESNALNLFLSHRLPWQVMQPIWKTAFVKQIGGFDPDFSRLQDVEFHTNALINKSKYKSFPTHNVDCFYRIEPERTTQNKLLQIQKQNNGFIQYYNKFFPLLTEKTTRKLISITLLEALSTLINEYKFHHINQKEFSKLTQAIIETCRIKRHQWIFKFYVGSSQILPFHVKGVKAMFTFLLKI